MDHQLVKSGKKWDIIESYEKHKNWMNSRLIEKISVHQCCIILKVILL